MAAAELRTGQPLDAARGPALPHRPGPLRRQHRARGGARRAVRALAARACADRWHRQGGGAARCPASWRSTPPRTRRPTGSATCPAISEIKDAAGNRHREPPHLPMPIGKVRHVGDIVAMVVADTLDQARDAAEALVVDYDPLPAVVTVAQALAPGAPLVHDEAPGNLMCRWSKGDAAATDAAFARAAHVTTLSIRSPRQVVHYMETRAAWSAYDAGRRPSHRHLRLAGRADPAPADVRARPPCPEGQAAAGHAGCRRRLRAEVSDLSRADPDRLGDAQARARPALERASAPSMPCPTAMRATSSRPASWRSMPTAVSSACA